MPKDSCSNSKLWFYAVSVTLLLLLSLPCASAFPILSSNQLVFVNVDHAPMGACSTITYGFKGDTCGLGTQTGNYPFWAPTGGGGGGVLFGLTGSSGLQVLPFFLSPSAVSTNAHFFPDASVQRTITPSTDDYSVDGGRLAFTHYSPAWSMPDFSAATLNERKRYLLPATWIQVTIQNTNNASEDFYFGLPQNGTQRTFANGAYEGFVLGEATLAVQTGSCELLSGARLTAALDGMRSGCVFHLSIPAGQTRSLMVVLAYYRSAAIDSRTSAVYYYTTMFPSIDSVIDAAFTGFGDAQLRCQQLASAIKNSGMNPYRQFLAGQTIHSYMADTACVITPTGTVSWREVEGIFNYINTFDLTEDIAFFDSLLHPWALRNVLDTFSGALPGTGYNYQTPLYDPSSTQVATNGFSFDHDMGLWPNSGTGPAYGANMGDEELQSWILSAGLYWSRTQDDPWLTNNAAVLQKCLNSMLARDNTNAALRDGITKNVNSGEITTFDNLDSSLRNSAFSGRMAVRNWACYLALNAMFSQIGDVTDAGTCENMAAVVAQTIVNRWNTYGPSLGYLPALLDGSNKTAVTPMIEGLAYPAAMGLTNAIDRSGGPYASMLQALSNHVVGVLVPGRGLDAASGAWLVSAATTFTWQSKVFLSQFAAEAVLGITNLVNGTIDQIHASLQIAGSGYQGYSDALWIYGAIEGGHHYPRGVTTATWWLNPTNNPSNPVATSAPAAPAISSALANDHQVLLLWQGVALAAGYNVKRATASGGPYLTLTNGISSASFIDSTAANGVTYYYILTATNQFGESLASPEVTATPIPSTPTSLSASAGVASFTVSWPSNYVGWVLQTNTVGLGNPSNWHDLPASLTNSQMTFPVSNPAIQFFRLRHP